jgi:hypothetical protein
MTRTALLTCSNRIPTVILGSRGAAMSHKYRPTNIFVCYCRQPARCCVQQTPFFKRGGDVMVDDWQRRTKLETSCDIDGMQYCVCYMVSCMGGCSCLTCCASIVGPSTVWSMLLCPLVLKNCTGPLHLLVVLQKKAKEQARKPEGEEINEFMWQVEGGDK